MWVVGQGTKGGPGSTRLAGHGLLNEGAGWVVLSDGSYHRNRYDRFGFARCSCGATSGVLESNGQRKRWHREHKDSIRGAV